MATTTQMKSENPKSKSATPTLGAHAWAWARVSERNRVWEMSEEEFERDEWGRAWESTAWERERQTLREGKKYKKMKGERKSE